jgi:hypothetical protein
MQLCISPAVTGVERAVSAGRGESRGYHSERVAGCRAGRRCRRRQEPGRLLQDARARTSPAVERAVGAGGGESLGCHSERARARRRLSSGPSVQAEARAGAFTASVRVNVAGCRVGSKAHLEHAFNLSQNNFEHSTMTTTGSSWQRLDFGDFIGIQTKTNIQHIVLGKVIRVGRSQRLQSTRMDYAHKQIRGKIKRSKLTLVLGPAKLIAGKHRNIQTRKDPL